MPVRGSTAAALDAYLAFEDEAGFSMTPPTATPGHLAAAPRSSTSADARRLRAFIDAQDWITAHYLPPYAPQLNPVEGVWSLLRHRCQANTAFADPAHLMRALRRGLRQVQYDLVDGCLAGTGLSLTLSPLPSSAIA